MKTVNFNENNFIMDYMVSPSAAIAKGSCIARRKYACQEPTDQELNSPAFRRFVAKVMDDALNGHGRNRSNGNVA